MLLQDPWYFAWILGTAWGYYWVTELVVCSNKTSTIQHFISRLDSLVNWWLEHHPLLYWLIFSQAQVNKCPIAWQHAGCDRVIWRTTIHPSSAIKAVYASDFGTWGNTIFVASVFYQTHLYCNKHMNLGSSPETNRTVGISSLILWYAWASYRPGQPVNALTFSLPNIQQTAAYCTPEA